jgi:hypothetical protein
MAVWTLVVFLLGQAAPAAGPGAEVRALTVTFLDQKDGEVRDLAPEDVALSENGVAREVLSFKPDARPLSVAVVVDSSLAMGSSYRLNFVDAVSGFVTRLPEGARYAVWTTGDRPTKVQDFTDDREAAGKALRRVAPQGGNYMLDAVAEASEDLRKLAREGDRTVVTVLTGTGPELSYLDQYRSAEAGERSGATFLFAQVEGGEADFEARTRMSYVFDRLARSSGGRHEVTLSAMSADSALRKLSAVLRSGYRLTYATVPEIKKRKLDLSVARPGTKVILPAESARDVAEAPR